MPRLFSVSTLLSMVKMATDTESDDHIARDFLIVHASSIYGELFGTVVNTGLRYFETSTTFTTAGPTPNVLAEPADQRSWISLDWLAEGTSTGRRVPVDEIMPQERNWAAPPATTGQSARYFELIARQYRLYPTPPIGQVYELRYIPHPLKLTTLASDGSQDATTELDVVTEDGEQFFINGVAVYVKARKRLFDEANFHRDEKNAARERLSEWAGQRAFHQPRRQVLSPERPMGIGSNGWWDWRL